MNVSAFTHRRPQIANGMLLAHQLSVLLLKVALLIKNLLFQTLDQQLLRSHNTRKALGFARQLEISLLSLLTNVALSIRFNCPMTAAVQRHLICVIGVLSLRSKVPLNLMMFHSVLCR